MAAASTSPTNPSPEPGEAPEPSGHRLAPGVVLGASCVRWRFARSGGPGGQNVNKVSSKASLEVAWPDLFAAMPPGAAQRLKGRAKAYLVGEDETLRLVITRDDSRKQSDNRRACLEALSAMVLASLVPPKVRKKTRPSRAAKKRRVDEKKQRGQVKARRKPPSGE